MTAADYDGGGVYIHSTPKVAFRHFSGTHGTPHVSLRRVPLQIGTRITVRGRTFIYEGDSAMKSAHQLDKCGSNVGMTGHFPTRESSYSKGEFTNEHQASARFMMVAGNEVDTIDAWDRKVALGIPAATPADRPIETLFLRIYETVTNVMVGATRDKDGERCWGLQRTCYDGRAYHHIISYDIANKLIWFYYENCVQKEMKWEAPAQPGVIKGTPNEKMWQNMEVFLAGELVAYDARKNKDIPLHMRGPPSSFAATSFPLIIRLNTWFRGYEQLPPIPLEHWGPSFSYVPDLWLVKIDENGKVTKDKALQATRERELEMKASKVDRPPKPKLTAAEREEKRKAEAKENERRGVKKVKIGESENRAGRHALALFNKKS